MAEALKATSLLSLWIGANCPKLLVLEQHLLAAHLAWHWGHHQSDNKVATFDDFLSGTV